MVWQYRIIYQQVQADSNLTNDFSEVQTDIGNLRKQDLPILIKDDTLLAKIRSG